MTELDFPRLREICAEAEYPLVFATISGAHLYGFPSRDSDVDVRGAHLLPLPELLGLRDQRETLDRMWTQDGVEYDLVTHDLGKFCKLLLGRNGNVLEMVLSPLVVATSPTHQALLALAPGCVTRNHAHHYRGFAATEWKLFNGSEQLKPLLYTFRALLTGIHMLRTGVIEANLPALLTAVPEAPGYLTDLITAKVTGEHSTLDGLIALDTLAKDVALLESALETERDRTALPERATSYAELDELLVRTRLA